MKMTDSNVQYRSDAQMHQLYIITYSICISEKFKG